MLFGKRIGSYDGSLLYVAPFAKCADNVTRIGKEVLIHGHELKDRKWRRTLRSLWHLFF